MATYQSDLAVITKAKELYSYIMTVTDKSPKRFRFKRRLRAFREKYRTGEMDYEAIKRSLASYNGHLSHGHTWKLKTKIYGRFVLT